MRTIVNGILLLLCLWAVPASAQRTEKLDTLAFGKRFSFHTNMIDWLMGTPNATVELDVTGSPYNRLAVLGGMKYNWNTHHTQNPRLVYNVFEISGEGRYYWHTRDRDEAFEWESDTTAFFMKNAWHHFRTRAAAKKKPRSYRAYYIGLYGEYDKYTILLKNGMQGKGVGVGVSGGFTQPLYQMNHGSIEVEIGGRAGFRYTRYDKFHYEEESACYAFESVKRKHFVPYPIIQDIHVSLVYRMESSKNKYKWNRDRAREWDKAWATLRAIHGHKVDSLRDVKAAKNSRKKFVTDSIAKDKLKKQLEDSIAKVHKKLQADSAKIEKRMRDSLERLTKDSLRLSKQKTKEAERLRKDSIEAAEKDSIERLKSAVLPTVENPIDTVAHIEEVPLPEPVEIPLPEESAEEGKDDTPTPEEPVTPAEEESENPVPEVVPEEPAVPEEEKDEEAKEQKPEEQDEEGGQEA